MLPPRLRSPLALALALAAALVGACTGKNVDHCNFRGGDAFCAADQAARPFCSVCAADFNGCVDAPPGDDCLPEGSSSASASGTTAPASTSSSSASGASSTSSTGASTSTSTASTGASTSTSTGESTSQGTGSTSDTDTSTSSTGTDTGTGTDGSTTSDGPSCGDNMADWNEICDGTDLRGKTCVDFGWSGGQLGCAANCASYDQGNCCQGKGSSCGIFECCKGLTCLGKCV
ncbi:MAG: hypothetical protein H6710_08855 [Myxococcales bacterium]|nr:hypothetical protein [Myxococcales bacterium]MCB9700818.1 hypothetical protein [Myxococcales bacterium]